MIYLISGFIAARLCARICIRSADPMENLRVCVIYFPWLYTDIFQQLFQRFEKVTIIENYFNDLYPQMRRKTSWDQADVMILSLDCHGSPEIDFPPQHMKQALLIAFSPHGDYGLQRRPNESHWEVVRPFGFEQLLQLVQEPDKVFVQEQLTRKATVEDAPE
jgi:hypothetical protein